MPNMPNWMKEPNWWMLVVTFAMGFLGFMSAEFGPFFNRGELKLFTKNYLNIGHDYGMLRINVPFDVLKTGKADVSIFKMQLYLK